jgi:hypothetical protein
MSWRTNEQQSRIRRNGAVGAPLGGRAERIAPLPAGLVENRAARAGRTGDGELLRNDPAMSAEAAQGAVIDSCLLCHGRRNGLASSRSNGRSDPGWTDAGSSVKS